MCAQVIFEVSSHGALITGAVMDQLTSQLIYSLDSGETFHNCNFTDSDVVVNNILTRSFNARNFLLEGRTALPERDVNGTWTNGLLIHFDFEDSNVRDCQESDCKFYC